jgi:hypothetical protein
MQIFSEHVYPQVVPEDKQTLKCSLCGKTFNTQNAMQNHLQSKKHKEAESKEEERVKREVQRTNEKNKEKGIEVTCDAKSPDFNGKVLAGLIFDATTANSFILSWFGGKTAFWGFYAPMKWKAYRFALVLMSPKSCGINSPLTIGQISFKLAQMIKQDV